ncbi:MAG: SHOCT domain-containing protein [Mycobacterium sp.]
MTGRLGPRIAIGGAVLTLVAAVVGFIAAIVLNVFVFDEFDAYGEVPIPGSGRLQLPAGEVTISFHIAVTGGVNGAFPVPALKLGITPPEGVPEPVVTETMGATTSINNDVRIRIWVAQIPRDGVYDISTGGNVGGYVNPHLSFGRDSSPAGLLWMFGGLAIAGMAALAVALAWRARSGKKARPLQAPISLDEPNWPGPLPPPV